MEETARGRRGHQCGDLGPAARLAKDHDPAGIAAKRRDVVAHPLKRQDQVELAGIPRPFETGREAGQEGVAEDVQPVVQGDDNHILAARQPGPVIEGIGSRPVRIGPAVDVDHHRPLAGVEAGGPDVQEEAVLGGRNIGRALWGGSAIGDGLHRVAPGRRRDRSLEPARGRVGAVSDALEDRDLAIARADDGAVGGADLRRRPFDRRPRGGDAGQGHARRQTSGQGAQPHLAARQHSQTLAGS